MNEEILKKLTILVPTKNRSHFLYKLLQYHVRMKFGGTMMVGDASEGSDLESNQQAVREFEKEINIIYCKHPSHVSLIEGTNWMLAETKTPYSVLSGDDDFLVPSGLSRCVSFLEENEDYSLACGEQTYTYIQRLGNGDMRIERIVAGYSKNHEEDLPSQRIVSYCCPSRRVNTFSVQRTKNMYYCWKKASQLGLDKTHHHSPLHETAVNVMSLIQGKQKKFPNLYHVMLRHNERAGGGRSFQPQDRWLERMCYWDWSDEVRKLLFWWAEELSKQEKLSLESAGEIADAVFLQCWIPIMTHWRDDLLRKNNRAPKLQKNSKEYVLQTLKKVSCVREAWEYIRGGKRISLAKLLDKKSPYYKDFLPIREILNG